MSGARADIFGSAGASPDPPTCVVEQPCIFDEGGKTPFQGSPMGVFLDSTQRSFPKRRLFTMLIDSITPYPVGKLELHNLERKFSASCCHHMTWSESVHPLFLTSRPGLEPVAPRFKRS